MLNNVSRLEDEHLKEMKYMSAVFATSMWENVAQIQSFLKRRPGFKLGKGGSKIEKNDYEASTLKELRNASIDALKKFTDTHHTPMASKGATESFNEFKENNPSFKYESIYECTYTERNKINLHREHPESNASFFDRILNECHNLAQVVVELSYHPGTCWVTSEENDILNQKGYRTNRPSGWKEAYMKCGIEALRFENCVNC